MESSEIQRDLDAEVSAFPSGDLLAPLGGALANVRVPNWFQQLTDLIGRSMLGTVDALEAAFIFLTKRESFVRKTGPGIRPEEEHEFIDPGKRHGRWGGGLV